MFEFPSNCPIYIYIYIYMCVCVCVCVYLCVCVWFAAMTVVRSYSTIFIAHTRILKDIYPKFSIEFSIIHDLKMKEFLSLYSLQTFVNEISHKIGERL